MTTTTVVADLTPDLLPQRIAERVEVDPASGCWLWRGGKSAAGYGWCRLRGARWTLHRLAYTLLVGPIPEGRELDHLCAVKHCCNPAHLEPVTRAENVARAVARRGTCPNGHAYDDANTLRRTSPSGTTWRTCRACRAARQRRWIRRCGGRRPAPRQQGGIAA